ncbi:DUF4236 domain-containing protein [Acinetobacter tibetensis]|uniref:DUF4236 domain-containing protein n=1 Tax=Acinetobacter tibetensis TaxID=2943497 RepID=A0AAE9LT72_9GAMM|nr:DUF4236 domain-containing protein [Acinetobacter tibetensis]USE84347.1 DUF4236 domain-containing protein [Acinetobacter tibetensis]
MGLNFRKSFKIAPGVRLNVGKKGVSSVSIGGKGARVSISKKGTRSTVSAPGTGLSYSTFRPHAKTRTTNNFRSQESNVVLNLIVGFVILAFIIWVFS